MDSTSKTIAKNAGVMMAAQLITWGLTLLLTVFLSRMLGPTAAGKFHLANSLWGIAAIFAIFGMDLQLVKEIARKPEKTPELLGTSLYLRIFLYILASVGVIIYSNLAKYPSETLMVIYIVGAANFILQFSFTSELALKGLEKMEYISLAGIVTKFVLTVFTLIVLFLKLGVIVVALVGIPAALINFIMQNHGMRRFTTINIRFHWPTAQQMLKACFPFLVVNLIVTVYAQVDIVVISLLANEAEVGWYGSADQLFGTFLFIPAVFNTAIYPALARMYANSPNSLGTIMRKSFDLMMLLAVPVGLGVLLIADQLVVLLFGQEFAGSGPVLAVMGIVLLLTYQNMLLGRFFMAVDRQKVYSYIMAVALAATIPLDLILIPWTKQTFNNGAIGGGLSFVVTELLILVLALRMMPKGILGLKNVALTAKVLLSGAVMLAVTWWLRDVFIAVPVLVGAAVYIVMVLVLHVVPPEDWEILKTAAAQILNRLQKRQVQPANIHGEN